ncbi:MAG: ATP-dependent sacrificial sulfur transferase LarE [Methanosphaera sp.]|nr:ATP-dependent sacrificial sulfur transferase LarE [Methanosphaera sp.]
MNTTDKIRKLEEYLKDKKCILAFSAGSDSSLIAYILSKVSPNSILATIDNNMMPEEFIKYAQNMANEYGLKHIVIKTDFLSDPEFISNNSKRCYNCRNIMYSEISKIPEFSDYDYFLEGTNLTDLLEDRPGVLIRKKYNMTSPLIECQLTKDDVWDMIDYLGLSYSNNTTCLATRIKTNQEVDAQLLSIVDKTECLLRESVDQDNVRIRVDDSNATIVVDDPMEILDKTLLENIRDQLKEYGFKKVSLDITGYTKTTDEYLEDNDTYYYQLPYNIDLDTTTQNIRKNPNYHGVIIISNNYIKHDTIKISADGRISTPKTEDFDDKFRNILPVIERTIPQI